MVSGPQMQVAGPQAPVTAQRYRSNAPVIGALVAVIVLALAVTLVWAGNRVQQANNSPTTPSETTPETPSFTPSPNWQGIEFTATSYGASGYWQAGPPDWQDDIVTVPITLSVDKNTLRFSFFALDNNLSNNLYDSIGGTMETGSVKEGQSQTGTVMFEIPRGDFTLYLATAGGAQITALIISG